MAGEPDLASETARPGRLRRAVAAALAPWLAILQPGRRTAAEVAAGRYGAPLLIVILCAALAALAIGARLDLGPEIRAENAGATAAPVSGVEQQAAEVMTDREIEDETAQRTAVTRVMLGLDAGLKTPGRILLLAFAIFLLGRFVGGTPTMRRSTAAAALVALPGAVRSAVTALAAWHQPAIRSADIDALVAGAALPLPDGQPVLARLLGGVDLFTCWSIVIFAVALGAAAELKRPKAFATAAVGVVLYLLVTGLIMSGGAPPAGAGN